MFALSSVRQFFFSFIRSEKEKGNYYHNGFFPYDYISAKLVGELFYLYIFDKDKFRSLFFKFYLRRLVLIRSFWNVIYIYIERSVIRIHSWLETIIMIIFFTNLYILSNETDIYRLFFNYFSTSIFHYYLLLRLYGFYDYSHACSNQEFSRSTYLLYHDLAPNNSNKK
jgi:hypothetical protein